MADVAPKHGTRKINTEAQSVEQTWLIVGAETEIEAIDALLAEIPKFEGNAPLQRPSAEEIADNIWESTTVWTMQPLNPPNEEDSEAATSFSTKGQKAKITQSRGTTAYGAPQTGTSNWTAVKTPVGRYTFTVRWKLDDGQTFPTGVAPVPPARPPVVIGEHAEGTRCTAIPDFKGAIGVERNGSDVQVHGVEATVPGLSFSKSRRFPAGWLDAERLKMLSRLTGSTNATEFLGFAPGELIFDGAEGTQKTADGDVDVKFDFIGSENVTGQTYGEIAGICKMGWEYLWFLYRATEDLDANEIVKRPIGAYVETVFPASDFGQIGAA